MIICVAGVLNEEQLQRIGSQLRHAQFEDGERTAGWSAAHGERLVVVG